MSDGAQPELSARHLLVCQEVLYDPFQFGAAYSLRGLITTISPRDDIGFPLAAEKLTLFAQVFGSPGTYPVGIDLVEVEEEDDEGTRVASLGPFLLTVRPGRFVEGVVFPLSNVPFPRPGVYEFRLRRGHDNELVIAERVLLVGG